MSVKLTHFRLCFLLYASVFCAVGCTRRPSPPVGPDIQPAASAIKAMELYDKDGDGVLSQGELSESPALSSATKRLDRDHDGRITTEELQQRLEEWVASRSVLVDAIAEVSIDGRPLPGATISLEPDPCLGEERTGASARTDETGLAAFSGHDPRLPGLHLGFYRVSISKSDAKGRETLPAKYNTNSNLGLEVAGDKSTLSQFRLASH